MKNIVLVILITVFWSCSDENDYDFNKIVPGKQTITGDSLIWGNGAKQYSFYAIPRGGSSYKWELISGPATIKNDSARAFLISLVSKSNKDTTIKIQVTETTMGGITGPASIKTLFVERFCEFDINALIGNFSEKAYEYDKLSLPSYGPIEKSVKLKKVTEKKVLIEDLLTLYPVELEFNGDAFETLTMIPYSELIDDNGTQRTLSITGSGTYNTCKNLIALDYTITYNNTTTRRLDTLRRE